MAEKDGSGTTTAVYQNDPIPYGRLRSMRRDNNTYTYRYDAQGNTTALTDDTGNTTDTYTYTAFGNEVAKTGTTTNPYRFGGQYGYQYNVSTGVFYIRARTYEPKQSRWMSKDPLRFVDSGNVYIYVVNDPSGNVDPSGMLYIRPAGNANIFRIPINKLTHVRNRLSPCGVRVFQKWDFLLGSYRKLNERYVKLSTAAEDGYFVQKVSVLCTVLTHCRASAIETDVFEYYEAWKIRRGKSRVYYPKIGGGVEPWTDWAQYKPQKNTDGHYAQKGEVRFYRARDIEGEIKTWHDPLKQGRKRYGKIPICKTSPHLLKSTGVKPKFWDKGKVIDGPAYRILHVDWCCCYKPRYAPYGGVHATAYPT